jgi:hypothetical protein
MRKSSEVAKISQTPVDGGGAAVCEPHHRDQHAKRFRSIHHRTLSSYCCTHKKDVYIYK